MSVPILPTSRRFITQLLKSLPSAAPPTDVAIAVSNPLSDVPDATKKQLLSLQVLFPNEFVPALDLLDRRLVTRFRICDGQQLSVPAGELQQGAPDDRDVQIQGTEGAAQTGDAQMSALNTDIKPTIAETSHEHEATIEDASGGPTDEQAMSDVTTHEHPAVYYVRSAQQRSSRYSTSYDTTASYEVRLTAWNCSCPAFAFSAFPTTHAEPPIPTYDASIPIYDASDDTNTTAGQAGNMHEHEDDDSRWIFGGISLGEGMPPVCKHLLACVLVEKCSGVFGGIVEEKNVSVEEAAGWAAGWGD
ncbi:hypothetical protein EJ02DRAFT_22831 [Clathrospora elynae]|uniref:SWIM-type domain-containing protein n=1 Tax=Clathrospora elynae TaxID=706981 RepID=A0A6A5SEI7_9PLEO|nr:hypothetical protein EJ02DRAFT_22831 [Clathrospora elynae]